MLMKLTPVSAYRKATHNDNRFLKKAGDIDSKETVTVN